MFVKWIAYCLVALSCVGLMGCQKGSTSLRLSDIVPFTTDTLTVLLIGEENAPLTRTAPTDKPLLEKGTHEAVVISADASSFADISRGALSSQDVTDLQKRVVDELNKRLQKKGFSATGSSYPPSVSAEKTLVATITPQTQTGGSDADQAKGRARTLVLVRVTITDPGTGAILAQREYYSGTDARRTKDGKRASPTNP